MLPLDTWNAEYWNVKGSALGKERRFEEAIMYFDRAIKIESDNPRSWYNKALCLKNLQRYSEALACLNQASRLAPDDDDIEQKKREIAVILKHRPSSSAWSDFAVRLRLADRRLQWVGGLIFAGVVAGGMWQMGQSSARVAATPIIHPVSSRIAGSAPVPAAADLSAVKPQSHIIARLPAVKQLPHVVVSLPSGTIIARRNGRGHGKLMVDNGTNKDAVVKMIVGASPQKMYCMMYVRANDKIEVDDIQEGTYRLLFASGTDWNAKKRAFVQDKSYSKFDDAFEFTEEQTEDASGVYLKCKTWRVTLNPVPMGNASKTYVSEDEFNRDD